MLKQKYLVVLLIAVLAMSFSTSAWAHDGWSQTNTPIVAQGETVYIDLLLGNHSNEHRSYRIDGQWSITSSKVYVTNPAGVKTDITSTRFYTGEPATETTPARNNGFIASFSAMSPGAYIISVEGDSVRTSGDVTSRTLRSAKSFAAVSDIPLLARVAGLQGFSKTVSADRAELVPLFNPAAVKPNQKVSVQLQLKGKPLANTEVSVIRRSDNSNPLTLNSDANGKITFTTGPADYYLVRAKPATNESKAGEYGSMVYEATMTFIVQNGALQPKSTRQASASPLVYINGKLVDAQGVRIVAGSAVASAAFLQEHLNIKITGSQAALRAEARKQGAVVEFMPAVGDNRPAILIYK
jgi:uncharacterized GH25 family protein